MRRVTKPAERIKINKEQEKYKREKSEARTEVGRSEMKMKRAISEVNARIVSWGDKFSAREGSRTPSGRQGRRRRGGAGIRKGAPPGKGEGREQAEGVEGGGFDVSGRVHRGGEKEGEGAGEDTGSSYRR